jgi:glucosamine--fructose-6-phosphate aminotransferase (isomerizing)
MCGIVGAVSNRPVCDILVDGLQRLEYRGYDSAGVTILDGAGSASCVKRQGKVGILASALADTQFNGTTGIAHTRWATHGPPPLDAMPIPIKQASGFSWYTTALSRITMTCGMP